MGYSLASSNPHVSIQRNHVHMYHDPGPNGDFSGYGIILGGPFGESWSHCIVANNKISGFGRFGMGCYPYCRDNQFINNNLAKLKTYDAQVLLSGRNDLCVNNTFGSTKGVHPGTQFLVTASAAVKIMSFYFGPFGAPAPAPAVNNKVLNNDYTRCGVTGWVRADETLPPADPSAWSSTGCIMVVTHDPFGVSVKNSFINEKKFPAGTDPVQQIADFGENTKIKIPGYDHLGKTSPDFMSGMVQEPEAFELYPNYPNPFNPVTTINYELPASSPVVLEIYNVTGNRVRTLVNSQMGAGYHSAVWDGRDDAGHPVAGGVYLYRMQAGEYQQTMRMLLLK